MIHFFHVLFVVFLSGNLLGMETNQQIIPFLPYAIAQSGTYTLAPSIEYKPTVRGNFFDSALRIHNGANVILNLNNMTLDAYGKKYAIDSRGAQSVFIYRGIIKNADILVNCFYNNVQLIDVIILKCPFMMNSVVLHDEYALNQLVLHSSACKQVKRIGSCNFSPVIIASLPRVITYSGIYYLSSDLYERPSFKKEHFNCAIRIRNKANVVLNLNGHVLDAEGRTFAIDANGAQSIFIYNGIIKNAVRAISSLNNNVWIKDICIDSCNYAAIDTTEQKTNTNNLRYSNCGQEK